MLTDSDAPYDPYLEGEYDDDEVGTFASGSWMTWKDYYNEFLWTPDDRHYRLEEEFYKRQDAEFERGEI